MNVVCSILVVMCLKAGYICCLFFPSDSSLLQDNVAFVLCLDTLGNGDSLHLHVSKPPKEGTPQYSLLKELEAVRSRRLDESWSSLDGSPFFLHPEQRLHSSVFLPGGCESVSRGQVLHGPQENQPGWRHAGVGARTFWDPPPARLHSVPPALAPAGSALQHHGRAVSVPLLSPRSGRAPCWVGPLLQFLESPKNSVSIPAAGHELRSDSCFVDVFAQEGCDWNGRYDEMVMFFKLPLTSMHRLHNLCFFFVFTPFALFDDIFHQDSGKS